jgi:CRP-like cAMP-binding protein
MREKRLSDDPMSNHLLSALPEEEFARLEPSLEPVSLSLGQVIYESGERLEHVYFPTSAIISLLYIMENGSTAEIGMSGNDGLVGIALYMGGSTTPSRAVVQSAGKAFKLRSKALNDEFSRAGVFQRSFCATPST